MKEKVKPQVFLDIPPSTSSSSEDGRMILTFPESTNTQVKVSHASCVEISDNKLVISFEPRSTVKIEAKKEKENGMCPPSSFYAFKHSPFSNKTIPDDIVTILDAFPNCNNIQDELLEATTSTRVKEAPESPTKNSSTFEMDSTPCHSDCIQIVHSFPNVSQDTLYNFFEAHGHFSREKVCPNCGDLMRVKYGRFECRKQNSARSKKRQIICYSKAAFKDSWFDGGIDKAKRIILICYLYVSGVPSGQLKQHVKAHKSCEWFEACQNVVIDFFKRSSQHIGGSGSTVEMLVTKVGISSSHLWVVGGIEVISKRSFVVTVSNLNKKFLSQVMSSWIKPGTKIKSDTFQIPYEDRGGFILKSENNASEKMELDSSDSESLSSLFLEQKTLSAERLIYNLFEKKFPKIEKRFHEFIIAAGVSYSKTWL